jgi:hypothetical protein
MTGNGCFVPRISMTRAARYILRPIEKSRWQLEIGATFIVDHLVYIFARVAMRKETSPRRAALLALLSIVAKSVAWRCEADRPVETVTKPNAERSDRFRAIGPWHPVSLSIAIITECLVMPG